MSGKTLVVGSTGYKYAARSLNWGEDFYVGDYDAVIFDVSTLSQEVLDKIVAADPLYFETIKKHIVELQLERGISIHCVLSRLMFASSVSVPEKEGDQGFEGCNYAWSPLIPILDRANGREINRKTASLARPYVQLLHRWEGYYQDAFNNTGYLGNRSKSDETEFRVRKTALLTNATDKAIGFELSWAIHKVYRHAGIDEVLFASKSSILFYPKPPDVKKGIEVILETLAQRPKEEPPPLWAEEVRVPGEEKILADLEQNRLQIQKLENNISLSVDELKQIQGAKALLYSKGIPLEEVVEACLKELGVDIDKAEIQGKEDRIIHDDGIQIPVEIRGKDSAALNEEDVRQVIARLKTSPSARESKTRGIFVLNHQRLTQPQKRGEPFHSNIVEDLVMPWGICLVTTETLYKMLLDHRSGETASGLTEKLLSTVGVLAYTKAQEDEPKTPKN